MTLIDKIRTFNKAMQANGKSWRDSKKVLDDLALATATGDAAKREELMALWRKLSESNLNICQQTH